MDQVRDIAKIIWQQRFWVLSVIGTLVAVACWHRASGDLQSRFASRIGAIQGSFGTVQSIRNEAFHPNDNVIKGDEVQAVAQSESVYQVWTELYDLQRTEVLSWPKELGEGFAKHMEGRRFRDEIDLDMRGLYRNYIENRFDGLLEIVKARKGGDLQSGRRFGEDSERAQPRRAANDENYLVSWVDQGELEARLSFDSTPTATQIWITQEDLWVYETLLNVIANTNTQKKATRPDNTAVREIQKLQVGQPAVATSKSPGQVYFPDTGGADGLAGGAGAAPPVDAQAYPAAPIGGPVAGDAELLANRYLDTTGQPISGDSVGAEYRQLPIHMTLTMDQRWIPQVLIECANAPLPVEVKWVRVNPENARSAIDGLSQRRRSESSSSPDAVVDPNLATVQIQGVVLIYGEPNKELLNVPGVKTDQGGQIADASAASS